MRRFHNLTAAILVVGSLTVSPVIAQTQTDPSVSTSAAVPATWDATVKAAFFADDAATQFKPASEVQQSFGSLTDGQQEQVRRDCETILGSGADAGLATDPADPTEEQSSEQPSDGPAEISSMNGLCTVIGSL